jgi:glycosyltransferase involved in cell wall biosynthesis
VTEPLVSVLLPVHDGERFLREAVESVLAQTLRSLQVIAVDDGSTDGTRAILDSFRDERLWIVSQPHLGLVAALNRAAREAGGSHLTRMDADDVSLPDRVERQAAFLDAHPRVGLVVCGVTVIDEGGRSLWTHVLPPDDASLRRRLLLRNPFTHGAVTMRREAFERAGGYRPVYGANEDYDLWRRIARDWELAALPEVLYLYREHAAAVTRTDVTDRVRRREQLRDELWRDPSLLRALGRERDRVERRALLREALRRRRPGLALRLLAG